MNSSEIKKRILQNAASWQSRNDEENTKLNISWMESNVLDFEEISLKASKWVFSHVPKTASTALESHLVQAFALKDILNVNSDELLSLPECLYLKNRWPNLITGSHPIQSILFQILEDKKIVHFSMMRDPVARVIAIYNDRLKNNYNSENQPFESLDLNEFINKKEYFEINNGQAKRFAGTLDSTIEISDKELYFRAKYCIDNCFSLVGVTEFFTQYYKLIAKKCGVKFHDLPPITRLETKVLLANINPDHLEQIKKNNKVDIQLYQYVRSKFLNLLNC